MHAPVVRRRLAMLAAAALLAAACDESPWSPENPFATFETDAAIYTPGAFVGVTIRNVSDQRISPATCPLELQRRAGGGWTTVVSGDLCTLILLIPLEPGGSTQALVEIPDDAPAGTYRVWFPGVRPMTDHFIPADLQSTDPFEVAALPPL